MPVTPRGRGRRLLLDMPEVKPGEEEDSGYTEAAKEPPVYLSPKKLISRSLKSTERRLSISEEEPTPQDSESLEIPNETDPLTLEEPTPHDSESPKIPNETNPLTLEEPTPHDSECPEIPNETNPLTLEEPTPHDSESPEIPNETDPLTLFKGALRENPFIICSAQFLVNPETTEELVIEWVEYVMRTSLTSTEFCITFASYFKTLTQHTVFGKIIKKVTIDYLQEYYEERTTSFEDKPADFNGSVNLLGHIFLRYQIKGKPLRVFAQPLLECLLMMCNSPNEENIKIVAEQISLNGKALESIVPETMMQLVVSVQLHLLDTTSDNLRTWLLLVVNLCFYGQPLSPEISEIFSTTIGLNTIKGMVPPSENKLQGEITDEFVKEFGNIFPE